MNKNAKTQDWICTKKKININNLIDNIELENQKKEILK